MLRTRIFVCLAVLVALAVALSWFHVLPGGYRLRGLLRNQAEQQAADHEAHRQSRLAQFPTEPPPPASGCVVFFGSSTIEYWPLSASFPKVPCLNRGIGAETVSEMLSRLAESLPAVPVLGFVLYAGSRELRTSSASPLTIADSVLGLIEAVRRVAPRAPVVLIGVLPDRLLTAADRSRLEALNAQLAGAATTQGFTFVPTDVPPLRDPETGRLPQALSPDNFHLTHAGYEILSTWIRSSASQAIPILK